MNRRFGENKFEDEANITEIKDDVTTPEIGEDDLDRISGGGNSAWNTIQQGNPSNPGS